MIEPRPEVIETPLVPHGGVADLRVLDFSANLNPFGPSPAVAAAVRSARWDAYPDPDAAELRGLLAARHGVGTGRVLVGSGSSELIDLVCRAYVRPGDRVDVPAPAYGEYERAARLCGAAVGPARRSRTRPRIAFLCSPANPTGRVTPAADVVREAATREGTLVVVDEAYADCVPGFESAAGRGPENLLVLRSLTKAHGLAGLRAGYAVGAAAVIAALRHAQVPWPVSAVALAGAAAALRDEGHTRRTVAAWVALRDELVGGLRVLGLNPAVAEAPFFLLPAPAGESWAVRLGRRGIAVRDCTSFGLPGTARVNPQLADDNARLVAAVREEVGP